MSRLIFFREVNNAGYTALDRAILFRNMANARCLLSLGADVNVGYPLHKAAKWGDVEIMEELVKKGAKVNRPGEKGRTPIFYAKDVTTAEFLLTHKAKLNLRDEEGETPLFHSILYSSEPVVSYLISQGADPKQLTKRGATTLHYAVLKGDLKMVKLLIKKGVSAHVKIKNETTISGQKCEPGTTALQLARTKGLPQIANILQTAGAKE